MLNKMLIGLAIFSVYQIHDKFQPDTIIKYDPVTQIVIEEYEGACVRQTVHLSGLGYSCKDLKGYLGKRGYNVP